MRIIVCVKQVDFLYHPFGVDSKSSHIDPEKMASMLNPYDEIAVEEAIRIKEHRKDCDVILVTAAAPEAEPTLRYAFAFGANRMVRVNHEDSDAWSCAAILAKYIKSLSYDIILCGKTTIDWDGNQMGSYLAELLNIPQVSGIVRLELSPHNKKARVDRYLGKGDRQVVECDLPALFTVERGLNDPRYPTLPNRLSAEEANIEVKDFQAIDIKLYQVDTKMDTKINFSPPRPKPKTIFTPDSKLSAIERMRLVLAGGNVEKKSDNIIEGKPEDAANQLIDILIREKFLPDLSLY